MTALTRLFAAAVELVLLAGAALLFIKLVRPDAVEPSVVSMPAEPVAPAAAEASSPPSQPVPLTTPTDRPPSPDTAAVTAPAVALTTGPLAWEQQIAGAAARSRD